MQISWDLDFREIRLDLFNKCYFLLKQNVLILQDLDTYFSPTGMFLRNFVRKFGMDLNLFAPEEEFSGPNLLCLLVGK